MERNEAEEKMLGFYDYTVVLTYCSVISAVIGIYVSLSGAGHPYIGVMLLLLCGLFDTFDGRVARSKKNRTDADKMIKKLLGLRIFEDAQGKTNLDLHAVEGELLLVSQFTLYADCKKGNRPSFIKAGNPDLANELYEYIIAKCRQEIPKVEKGIFGADMKVSLLNDGPFTKIGRAHV